MRPGFSRKEVIPTVSEVKVREGETFESALRRFNKKIKQNGILSEVRRREHYEKPSVRRKRKLLQGGKRRVKTPCRIRANAGERHPRSVSHLAATSCCRRGTPRRV